MITETLSALIELQEIDREIYMLKTERASKPEALKALGIELSAITKQQEEALNEREAFASRQRLLEGDAADHDAAIEKYSGQLNQVKSNKEYQALLHDIESEKANRKNVEERILETMEQIQHCEQQLKELEDEAKGKKERLEDEEKEVRRLIDEIDEELTELVEQRTELVGPVPPATLASYERLLDNYGGQALSAVENQTCTGCYSHLPLNTINRIHIGEDFVKCPSCNRILYIQ